MHVHALRNYSEKNAVATGTATITSGSAVVTTALASQAVVDQMLRIIGAGGNGLGPLVGKISAVNTGAGTVTLVTLDGRPCVATASVTAAAATLNNVDKKWTVWAGTPGIVSRQAAPTTTGNTKAVAAAVADGYTAIIVNALSSATGEGWLVFRGVDSSNYWRFGFTTGTPPTLLVQKIVAGGATQLLNLGQVAFHAGIRLGVLHSGPSYTVYADGLQVGTFTDSFNQTATLAGWQSSDTPARFGPIYSRALVAGK